MKTVPIDYYRLKHVNRFPLEIIIVSVIFVLRPSTLCSERWVWMRKKNCFFIVRLILILIVWKNVTIIIIPAAAALADEFKKSKTQTQVTPLLHGLWARRRRTRVATIIIIIITVAREQWASVSNAHCCNIIYYIYITYLSRTRILILFAFWWGRRRSHARKTQSILCSRYSVIPYNTIHLHGLIRPTRRRCAEWGWLLLFRCENRFVLKAAVILLSAFVA